MPAKKISGHASSSFTYRHARISLTIIFIILILSGSATLAIASAPAATLKQAGSPGPIYLPIIRSPLIQAPRINLPYFEIPQVSADHYHQAAVFWFGAVRDTRNYTDVRLGYHPDGIFVRLSIFDRYLWNDLMAAPEDLEQWDAITLYLETNPEANQALDTHAYRFVAELGTATTRTDLQAAYQWNGSAWSSASLTFYTSSGWKGSGPNNPTEDRGYALTFHIPYSALELSGPPAHGEIWRAALTLHDRDDAAGNTRQDTRWPDQFDPSRPRTWGVFSFGLPTYTAPPAGATTTYTIRQGLNGIQVSDGVVGGNTLCGQGQDFWTEWGDHVYTGAREMNAQNQGNIDDWPCFSKFFITFPLDSLPTGKVIVSATLSLSQSGQSTGFDWDPPQALESLLQVFLVDRTWDETALTWNNSPLVQENISQAWVGPLTMAEWGIARVWDVSYGVAKAYQTGGSLQLAVYSADNFGPNGKYLLSSETGEYAADKRPTLTVVLGER